MNVPEEFGRKPQNEQNACRALIRILKLITGLTYECESCPDITNNPGPEVDFILKSTCNTCRVAVEHTIIELFPRQKEHTMHSFDIAKEINARCQGKIPSKYYYTLSYPPIDCLQNKRERISFIDLLVPWIIQEAPQLKVEERSQYVYEGHEITLVCGGSDPLLNGRVGRIPGLPFNIRAMENERFHSAIKHSLKKLKGYRQGFTTVMLLEDIAGIGHERLTKNISSSDKAEVDRFIDYIIVLESNQERMISGYVWKEDLNWYYYVPGNKRFDLLSLRDSISDK